MMKNKAALKFKNFTARPHFFWVRTKPARAGAAFFYLRLAEAVCIEISNADGKPIGVGKNLKSRNFKSLNFKNRNAMSTNCEADRYIDFSADYDTDRDIRFIAYCCSTCQSINFNEDRNLNLNICHDINSSADYDIRLGADLDINSDRHRAINFKISNANLRRI